MPVENSLPAAPLTRETPDTRSQNKRRTGVFHLFDDRPGKGQQPFLGRSAYLLMLFSGRSWEDLPLAAAGVTACRLSLSEIIATNSLLVGLPRVLCMV
jgi:hypothetical protein